MEDFRGDIGFIFDKSDDAILTGIAYGVGTQRDSDGDYVATVKDLESAANSFLENGGNIMLNHRVRLSPHRAQVVQSFVTETATTVSGKAVPPGSFVLKIRILDPDLITDIRQGVYKALSIAGTATRSGDGRLTGLKLREVSIVPKGAYKGENLLVLKAFKEVPADSPEELERQRIQTEIEEINRILQEPKDSLLPETAALIARMAVEQVKKMIHEHLHGKYTLEPIRKKMEMNHLWRTNPRKAAARLEADARAQRDPMDDLLSDVSNSANAQRKWSERFGKFGW